MSVALLRRQRIQDPVNHLDARRVRRAQERETRPRDEREQSARELLAQLGLFLERRVRRARGWPASGEEGVAGGLEEHEEGVWGEGVRVEQVGEEAGEEGGEGCQKEGEDMGECEGESTWRHAGGRWWCKEGAQEMQNRLDVVDLRLW